MGKELFGAFLVRVFDHLVGRAFLDHHAAIHKQDAVCHIARKRHFVRDNDHGSFLVGQIAQNAQNFAGQLRVKGAGWFIKAKDIRFQRQGESFGAYTIGMDEKVIPFITSANVACGFHAGDPLVMQRTVALCKQSGAAVGAHPGFPDLQGFGRRQMKLTPAEAKACVQYQIGALKAFCDAAGVPLHHVKPHGALYNMAGKDRALADAICAAVKESAPGAVLLALSGSEMVKAAQAIGLPVANEVFADRGYRPDGSLVPRGTPGAMIEDEDEAIARVIRMVTEGKVTANDGTDIAIQADSVCVHGDGPKALAFVEKIGAALQAAGVELKAF